ncbi:C45 family peptidase [Alcaligenes sp. SDU_A2]|uniref:C45 family peptidase n=1 Tax=Alcaligenes sp. SDU_A2 TaxID=3136634 RepID=UPI002CD186F1|nr:C45 family autoproteolytic acyltransferase/hydrolase [Alcaligenes sp.]HRL26318.1 C45 family autoproteolytic acyltransferase/hydrolase [Alcaligenes sp.]
MAKLSYLELSGGPKEIGHSLGRFGAPVAHAYLIHSPAWQGVMQWKGSEQARRMAEFTERYFPRIWTELQGLALGLELPFEDVLLWNCRGDIWAMTPDGCTTVQMPGDGQPRIVHNEDGDPGFAGHCGVAKFIPDSGMSFISFVYPASIPGHTLAVTQAGLAMTVNNVRARQVQPGVPRMVLTRAMLDQPSLDQAVAVLRDHPRSGAFHLSLAQRGDARLLSVEFSSQAVSVLDVTRNSLHANHAIHPAMQGFEQQITRSSQLRQERGDQLLEQAAASVNPLAVLADQHHVDYPIWRCAPDDSDAENTLATVDIQLGSQSLKWQVYENPTQEPRFRFADITRLDQD